VSGVGYSLYLISKYRSLALLDHNLSYGTFKLVSSASFFRLSFVESVESHRSSFLVRTHNILVASDSILYYSLLSCIYFVLISSRWYLPYRSVISLVLLRHRRNGSVKIVERQWVIKIQINERTNKRNLSWINSAHWSV
jgi:hypothetical protein